MGLFSSDKEKTKVIDPRTREQQQLLKEVIGMITGQLRGPQPAFTEEAPGFQPSQQSSLAALEQIAMGGGPGGEAYQASGAALTNLLKTAGGGDPTAFNEYFNQAVQAPALEAYREDVLPAISRGTAESGFFGSARREADARSSAELIDALTQARATGAYQSREAGLNRLVDASRAAQSGRLTDIEASNAAFAAAGEERQALLEQFAARRAEFQRQLDELYRRLGLAGQVGTSKTFDVMKLFEGGGMEELVSGISDIISSAVAK
jgi:flagellar motility protein MotE (MotC chaperone)